MDRKFSSIMQDFYDLPDPRDDLNRKHLATDIVAITICGVISGAEGWNEIERFGKNRKGWLESFLLRPNGIPSHDTFRRFFLLLDPDAFSRRFLGWTRKVSQITDGEVVAIDGKTLRRTYQDQGQDALHMISAWATHAGMSMGQVRESTKSNEITAIPKLLDLLSLENCLVTIDAMDCQKEIAKKIVSKKAGYVLAVKGNQGKLHEQIREFFEDSIRLGFQDVVYEKVQTIEKDHGRTEERTYYMVTELDWLEGKDSWVGLKAVGMVISKVKAKGKTTTEKRFYIATLTAGEIKVLAQAIRSHWGIENSLHWFLDVNFREDQSRKRKDNSAINFSFIVKIALNLLKREKTFKGSIRGKRLEAAWNPEYLEKVISS